MSTDNKIEEINENTKDKKSEKKKSHGNKLKVFMMLLVVIIGIATYTIISGAWNLFKSKEISAEAKRDYENSNIVSSSIYEDLYEDIVKNNSDDFTDNYKEDGIEPFGFEITSDHGTTLTENGVLKEMHTILNLEFENVYGLNNFFVYYMANEDYANEKYVQIKGSLHGKKDYIINDTTKIAFGCEGANYDELAYIIIKKDNVIYNGLIGGQYTGAEDYPKIKKLLDKLNIDFELPKQSKFSYY
ncbi:MAG: hypothetical protein Q4Q31_03905 [Bacillota bacterium]|nr:hypothetical protein [Bacillota bacterium]